MNMSPICAENIRKQNEYEHIGKTFLKAHFRGRCLNRQA